MEKINKDEIYILQEPKKLLQTVIVLDQDLDKKGLGEKEHNTLGWLVNHSDVMFLFSEQHWPGQGKVWKEKFTSLYQGCGFMSGSGKSLGKNIIDILEYDKEILGETKQHLGYIIINASDLGKLYVQKIMSLVEALPMLSRPIYTRRRLGSSEFHDIYLMKPDELKSMSPELRAEDKWKGVFRKIINALREKCKRENKIGMFSTWHTESPMMFFPCGIVYKILDYVDKDNEFYKIWAETFITPDFRFFMASLVEHLGLDILNMELENVKV